MGQIIKYWLFSEKYLTIASSLYRDFDIFSSVDFYDVCGLIYILEKSLGNFKNVVKWGYDGR